MEQYQREALEAVTTRPRRSYGTIRVEPITPVIGAEVSGVDLTTDLSEEVVAEIRDAFLDHHVLVFRDQDLTVADHKRTAAHFGELRLVEPPPEHGDPVVLEVATRRDSKVINGNGWHADGTADDEPSLGSMLHMQQIPETGSGGDTLFANMHLAYTLLSPALRGLLGDLTAVHDGRKAWGSVVPPPGHVIPSSEHPVVISHPETARPTLYVNRAYTTRIPQLAQDESDALLELLFRTVERQAMLHCRVRWAPRTLVFWDNRAVQHHALHDYYPFTRSARRIAINGGPLKG
ncbi:TauD/TfdA family dioxygenase [Umezawaea sp. Da 62-37]|uniref:TauD/TfdA dioxygenase family protein n=1 Tax=Umezawaea sp. Da 62-37 TaxID=3075927 RepID=UPI0028F734FA|nr:TauD/TfdA family dioxygenase [Umezawaea sp. Da 62-37]WNV88972.1 TauD/TfdA family dioxygenase [Umezawaea sp. Da 62-37]